MDAVLPQSPKAGSASDRHAAYNKSRLFVVSVLALVTAGISFSIRSNIAGTLEDRFLKPINAANSATMKGEILGIPFLGFAITIAIGSPLLDFLGMGRLLGLSALCFVAGTLTVMGAPALQHHLPVYWVLWGGMLVTGIGWGLVETVINPLTATLYPDEKTHKLNVLHAWWPGGLILGSLIGFGIGKLTDSYQAQLATVLVPAVIVGVLLLGSAFPPTERVAAGVSAAGMWKECLNPFFLVWFAAMFLTASSELAPGQWVQTALTRTVHMQGILLLAYVSAIMFVMRHFAGPMAHRFSPVGLLWISCLLAGLGLLSLSYANSPVTGLLAATVWGTGVCYLWPTMLAASSERFPRGGALLMGLMGTAGTTSVFFVLPQLGKIVDHFKAASGEDAANQISFRVVAVLPAILLFVFGAIWLRDRARGGYKAASITEALGETTAELCRSVDDVRRGEIRNPKPE